MRNITTWRDDPLESLRGMRPEMLRALRDSGLRTLGQFADLIDGYRAAKVQPEIDGIHPQALKALEDDLREIRSAAE